MVQKCGSIRGFLSQTGTKTALFPTYVSKEGRIFRQQTVIQVLASYKDVFFFN